MTHSLFHITSVLHLEMAERINYLSHKSTSFILMVYVNKYTIR